MRWYQLLNEAKAAVKTKSNIFRTFISCVLPVGLILTEIRTDICLTDAIELHDVMIWDSNATSLIMPIRLLRAMLSLLALDYMYVLVTLLCDTLLLLGKYHRAQTVG